MPICPICGEANSQLGAKCHRDEGYYVHDKAVALAENDPRIGTMAADKYVIVGRISKGGMGAVYKAIQMPVEREIAFKVLRTEMEGSDQGRDRFIREARAVSRLTHPNIITLHDFGFESSGHPYMVMEYAPGKDMGAWMRTEQMSTERIAHVLRQLLSALEEAHLQGIVHRDLKPENMIVTPTASDPDFVKLLDFGIARLINETSTRGLTREGEVFGTPHYMAPEQAQGAKEVGPAADIYAVGIMLFEMLTGNPPFDAPTPLAVLLMHINEELPELTPRPGVMVNKGLMDILNQATHKDAAVRYQDASEMLRALDEWMAASGLGGVTGTFRNPFASTPGSSAPTDRNPAVDAASRTGSGLISTRGPGTPVSVLDPDPTDSVPRYDHYGDEESDTLMDVQSGSGPNKRPLLIIGILGLVILAMGGVVVALSMGGGEPEGRESVVTNSTTKPSEDVNTMADAVAAKNQEGIKEPESAPDEPPTAIIKKDEGEAIDPTDKDADIAAPTSETTATDEPVGEPSKVDAQDVAGGARSPQVAPEEDKAPPKQAQKKPGDKRPRVNDKRPAKTPDKPKPPVRPTVDAWELPPDPEIKPDKW